MKFSIFTRLKINLVYCKYSNALLLQIALDWALATIHFFYDLHTLSNCILHGRVFVMDYSIMLIIYHALDSRLFPSLDKVQPRNPKYRFSRSVSQYHDGS